MKKVSLPTLVQVTLGAIVVSGLIAMSFGAEIVPKDAENKALFNRIVDAIWLLLDVPTLAAIIRLSTKKEEGKNEKDVSTGTDGADS